MDKKITIEMPIMPVAESNKTPSPAVQKINSDKKTIGGIDLNILLKFIKPYDGSRDTINSFLMNCNNAYELATESQRYILFKYILSQLQGKAEIATSIKDFTTYDQLKEFLKTQFCQRKHFSHLITDLQESKQSSQESVVEFSTKIESTLTQLLTEISMNPTKKSEILGRTAAMEDLALHHFLMGLHPRISNIVRCRSPKNLNEAIGLAISEEKIQQTLYRKVDHVQKDKKALPQNHSKFYKPHPGQFTPRPFQGQLQNSIPKYNQGQFTPGHQGQQRTFYRPPPGPPNNNSFAPKPQGFQNNRFNNQQRPQFDKQRINFVEEEETYDEPDSYPGPSVQYEHIQYDGSNEHNHCYDGENTEEYQQENNLNE